MDHHPVAAFPAPGLPTGPVIHIEDDAGEITSTIQPGVGHSAASLHGAGKAAARASSTHRLSSNAKVNTNASGSRSQVELASRASIAAISQPKPRAMPSSTSLRRPSLTSSNRVGDASSNASIHKGGNASRSKSALAANGPPDRASMRSLSRGDVTKKEINKWDEFYAEYQSGMGDIDRVLKSLTTAKSFLGSHTASTHSVKRSSPSVSRPRTPSPAKQPSPSSRRPASAASVTRSTSGLAKRAPSPTSARRGSGTQRDLRPVPTPSKHQPASLRASAGSVNSVALSVGNLAPSPSRSSLAHVGFQTPVRGSQVLLSSSQRDLIDKLEAAAVSQSSTQHAVPTVAAATGATAAVDESIILSASMSASATPSRSLYSNHADVSIPAIAIEPPSRLPSVVLDDSKPPASPEKPNIAPSQQNIATINASRASVDNVADIVFNRSSVNLGIGFGQLGAPSEAHLSATATSAANLTPSQANMTALFSNQDLDAKPRRSTARLASTTRLTSQSPTRQRGGHSPAPTNTPPNERAGGVHEDYAANTRAAAAEAAVVRLQARLTEKNTTISNLAFRVRQLERQVHWAQVQGQANAAAAGLDAAHRTRVRELEGRLAKDAEVIRGLVKEVEAGQGRERAAKETMATFYQQNKYGIAAAPAPAALAPEIVRVVETVPVPVVVEPAVIRQSAMAVRSCQESGMQSSKYPQFASAISRAVEEVRTMESHAHTAEPTHSRLHVVPDPSATITRLFNCITDLTGAIEQHFVKQVVEPVISPRIPMADATTQSHAPAVVHSETQSVPAPATWESSVQASDHAEAQTSTHQDEAVGPDSARAILRPSVSVATETVHELLVHRASAATGTDAVKTESASVQTAAEKPSVLPNGTQTQEEVIKPIPTSSAAANAKASLDVLLAMFAKMNAQPTTMNGGSGSEVDQLLLRLLTLKGENERLRRRQSTQPVPTTPAVPPQQQALKEMDGQHSRELAELRHAIRRLEERLLAHSSFTSSTPSTTSSSIPPPPPPPPVLFPEEPKPSAPKPSKSHKKRHGNSSSSSSSSSDASTPPRRSRHRHRSSRIPPPQNIDIQLGPSPQSPASTEPILDPKLVAQLESVTQANQALELKIQGLEHQLVEMQTSAAEVLKADHFAFKYQPPNLDSLRDAEHAKAISDYQSQLAHLTATVQSLHDQLAHRDGEIAHLRDHVASLQSLGPQWSPDLDRLVESLSHAVAEQQRQSETHLEAARGMVRTALAGEQQERANAHVLADAVRAHVAKAAELVRELDDTRKQLSAAKAEVGKVGLELEREREGQVRARQMEQECRADLGRVQAKLAAYEAQWAAVAHLAPVGTVEGQFGHVCQHLAMDLERQRDHARAMQAEVLGLRQARDAAEASAKDHAAKVDRLAELVSRAERGREEAVKKLTQRVKRAERDAADAKTRLARVLKGVYLYVASASAGETLSPSATGLMMDATVPVGAAHPQSVQIGSGDVEAILANLAGSGAFASADMNDMMRDSSMLDGLSELGSFGLELSPVQKVGHLPPPLQDDLQAILNEQVDDDPRTKVGGRGMQV